MHVLVCSSTPCPIKICAYMKHMKKMNLYIKAIATCQHENIKVHTKEWSARREKTIIHLVVYPPDKDRRIFFNN